MSRFLQGVRCQECGDEITPYQPEKINCERCGSPWLEGIYDYPQIKPIVLESVVKRRFNLWRYRELLPIGAETAVSVFDEGGSPLIKSKRFGRQLGLDHLYIKDERQSTTGSFKDRQAALAVAAMRQRGIKTCVMASAGNAAAAYSAYCAQAGIKLWVFVSSKVVPQKMQEVALYGAEVVKVSGTYDQTKVIAADFAKRKGIYYERGAKSLPSISAMKTIAYEIAEQLDETPATWQAPDWYVQAVSGGLGPLGVYQGFQDLYALGLIDRIPKLAVIQVDGCAPMVTAFKENKPIATPIVPRTYIDVLSTGNPGFAYTTLYNIVQAHGGTMVSVADEDAFRAMRRVARAEGISMEPAAAVAFAGVEKMCEQNLIAPHEKVVVNCTGHTFPVEKYILGDQWSVSLDIDQEQDEALQQDGLAVALDQLDERVTTIVLVDDQPKDILLIKRFLEQYKQYRVHTATNGHDGIHLIREKLPDLVITDLMMPEVDGFTLLETIKADSFTAHIPVIVVSAKDLSGEEASFLGGSTEAVWQKGSLTPKEFVKNVVDVLDKKQGTSTSRQN